MGRQHEPRQGARFALDHQGKVRRWLELGDLFALACTTAIHSLGSLVTSFFVQVALVPKMVTSASSWALARSRRGFEPCEINGTCQRPLGSTTVGLICLNPEGPVRQQVDGTRVPDPDLEETHLTARTFFSLHAFPIAIFFFVLVLLGSEGADAHDVKTLFSVSIIKNHLHLHAMS